MHKAGFLKYLHNLLDLVLPGRCFLCDFFSREKICEKCSDSIDFFVLIVSKQINHVEIIIVLTDYNTNIKKLMSLLKFDCIEETGELLNYKISKLAADFFIKDVDYWVPVPLHRSKCKVRGFNQLDIIFKGACDKYSGKYTKLVVRNKNTPPLFNLNITERQSILRGVFSMAVNKSLTGKKIVILDDILTTGSTVSEIARLLKTYGADEIYVLTVASVKG